MQPLVILLALAFYTLTLFGIGWLFSKRDDVANRESATTHANPFAVGLSLTLYLSVWLFFGYSGITLSNAWVIAPFMLAPLLLYGLCYPLLARLAKAASDQNSTSLVDFLSGHYGRKRWFAASLTFFFLIAILPFLASVLRVTEDVFVRFVPENFQGQKFLTILVLLLIAPFCTPFGTREIFATRPNKSLVWAMAVNALFILALLSGFTMLGLVWKDSGTFLLQTIQQLPKKPLADIPSAFLLTILVMGSTLCLPQQFHLLSVECSSATSLRHALSYFLFYLISVSLLLLTLSITEYRLGQSAQEETFSMLIAELVRSPLFALLFVLGFFAVTLSLFTTYVGTLGTMVANEMLLPIFLHLHKSNPFDRNFSSLLLMLRYVAVGALLLCICVLASLSIIFSQPGLFVLLLLSGCIQFLPGLLGLLCWRKGTALGVFCGMCAGFAVLGKVLYLPLLGVAPFMVDIDITQTAAPLVAVLFLTLAVNGLLFILFSLFFPEPAMPTRQEPLLLDKPLRLHIRTPQQLPGRNFTNGDLADILANFTGRERAVAFIGDLEESMHCRFFEQDPADARLIRFTSNTLARIQAPGVSEARKMLNALPVQQENKHQTTGSISGGLTQQRSEFEEILKNLSIGVVCLDRNAGIKSANGAFLHMYTLPRQMFKRTSSLDQVLRFIARRGDFGPTAVEEQTLYFMRHIMNGNIFRSEHRLKNKILRIIEGRPSVTNGYILTFQQNTIQYIAQPHIEQPPQWKFDDYIDTVAYPSLYIDHRYRLLATNQRYRDFFIADKTPEPGTSLETFLSTDLFEIQKPYIDKAYAGEETQFELRNSYADSILYFEVNCTPFKRANNQKNGVVLFYHDVSERRKAELALIDINASLEKRNSEDTQNNKALRKELAVARKEAITANESKTKFLAVASHDMLQPLNAARLFNSALIEDLRSGNVQIDLAEKLQKSLDTAKIILTTLLDLSKLDAGSIKPDIRTFSISELLSDIYDQYDATAKERNLRLRVVRNKYYACTDNILLKSVLQNLVSNSLRYTKKGSILIGCRLKLEERKKRYCLLQVIDTGVGIPKEKINMIFKEFTRLSRDVYAEGVGLGLSIVDRIVRLLDLELSVHSTPGKGTCFSIKIPIVAYTENVTEAQHNTMLLASDAHILCLDNDPPSLEALETLLKRWKIRVSVAKNMDDVLTLYKQPDFSPQIIIVDYHLDDGVKGFEAIDFINKKKKLTPPFFILITTDIGDELRKKAQIYQIPILYKPLEAAQLRNLLNRYIRILEVSS